jgi:hypothetical protein
LLPACPAVFMVALCTATFQAFRSRQVGALRERECPVCLFRETTSHRHLQRRVLFIYSKALFDLQHILHLHTLRSSSGVECSLPSVASLHGVSKLNKAVHDIAAEGDAWMSTTTPSLGQENDLCFNKPPYPTDINGALFHNLADAEAFTVLQRLEEVVFLL